MVRVQGVGVDGRGRKTGEQLDVMSQGYNCSNGVGVAACSCGCAPGTANEAVEVHGR